MLLPKSPLYEDVANELRKSIFSHKLPPGSWVDEQALALQLGISRTPMREAIKVLASEGLITMKPRRGAYVTEVSKTDLEQIFHIISILEGEACKIVAQKATERELDLLDNIHSKLEKAAADRNIELFFEINQDFHSKIQEIAGNLWMKSTISDLRKVLKLQRYDSLMKSGRIEQSLLEHRKILSAIINREATLAEDLMKEHLKQGQVAAS
ncbi:MAG: GntR family transcriptional regulator [Betaproteobacteria bacterium]